MTTDYMENGTATVNNAVRVIRPSTEKDIPAMMELVRCAKAIMRSDGNMEQWADPSYPSPEAFSKDIALGHSFIIEDDGVPCGTFAFIPGIEPTYLKIYDGQWLDDTLPYATIHRIASTPGSHGIARDCFAWCLGHCSNLRIDTHRDNHIMQHVIAQAGFSYCGIIYLADGAERLAYQLLKDAI